MLKVLTAKTVWNPNKEKFEDFYKRNRDEIVSNGGIITKVEGCPEIEGKSIKFESHLKGLRYNHDFNNTKPTFY